MSNDDLKNKAVHLAVDILVARGFKNIGFLQAKAAGWAAKWIIDNHGTSIWDFFTDTVELMTIISKSRFNEKEALEDYRILQRKKANRIADNIYEG